MFNITNHVVDCGGAKTTITDNGRLNIKVEKPEMMTTSTHWRRPAYKTRDTKAKIQECHATPSLNIVIQVVGSRGDIQPFVALGLALARAGHRIRIATHGTFKEFVETHGLEFFNIGGDPKRLMAYMVKNPGLMPSMNSLRSGDIQKNRADIREILDGCWRACFQSTDEESKPFFANAIIANPPSFAHIHCAEKLGVPLHIMFTMPWSPTHSFPHPLANLSASSSKGSVMNYLSYTFVEILTWEGLGDVINSFRCKTLGLKPLDRSSGPTILSQLRIPYTYCWSPTLIRRPEDWAAHISISGFYFLPKSSAYTPPPELEEFLNGPSPIYIGFGSIIVDDPKKLTLLLLEAIELAGVRAIISQGWGELGSEDLVIPPNVHFIGSCPHDWIFEKVSCVVHHGGAGTTAAAMACGKPSIVVPFFGDQPFWGSMIAKIGAGPKPIPFKKLTAPDLAAAISAALEPEIKQRAMELGEQIRNESGVDAGVTSFHHHLEHSNLSCGIVSSLPAAWKIRGTDIQLGSTGVALLVNRGLLSTDKIELLRPQKYDLNIGPRDPFSGMAFAFIDSAAEISGGLGHFGASTQELFRSIFEKGSVHSGKRSAFASSMEGIGKASINVVRAPIDISFAFTQGLHNAPKLWGDHHVELPETVEGIPTGLTAASKELVFGVYNGFHSLIMFPGQFAAHRGKRFDILPGLGFGTASCITKSLSGLTAIITYPLKGVDVELTRALSTRKLTAVEIELLSQGSRDIAHMNEEYIKLILERWEVITHGVRKGKLKKRKYHWPHIGRGNKPVKSI